MFKVEHISIPPAPWGRRPLKRQAVVHKASALKDWIYLSSEPDVYTLEDFWEEALLLRKHLEELAEAWGE